MVASGLSAEEVDKILLKERTKEIEKEKREKKRKEALEDEYGNFEDDDNEENNLNNNNNNNLNNNEESSFYNRKITFFNETIQNEYSEDEEDEEVLDKINNNNSNNSSNNSNNNSNNNSDIPKRVENINTVDIQLSVLYKEKENLQNKIIDYLKNKKEKKGNEINIVSNEEIDSNNVDDLEEYFSIISNSVSSSSEKELKRKFENVNNEIEK
jgi:hypothetical protein